jgi:putative photosynthetic complex assembly protein 2
LAIAVVGVAIVAITWGQPNQVGTWTFMVLWAMRTSAKLNLFLGVRNLSEEFLPPQLSYLQSFFRRRAMNPLLPLSVLGGCAVLVWMIVAATNSGATPAQVVGLTLVGTMLAMAIVEHLLLVLPIPSTALWRWALRAPSQAASEPVTLGRP